MKELKAYEIIRKHELKDLKTEGTLLLHKKSGARILCMENKDPNKVFYVCFRTPVSASTGVPHIVEHTVLCGSDKFPIKDPFVELAKGSLNTFLNALTFPDKTIYPVASENAKDFRNLCDVYLDAVFHPNFYHEDKIFKQEGWHYELEDPEGEITINGVVYNEMKGAFSSPDDVLSRQILNTLHPDTNYAFESGGDPKDIPTLTYEDYLKFHGRYYHPSNAYIYFYGDMDMNEQLEWLDEAYLGAYDRIEPDSEVGKQKPFTERKDVEVKYNIAESEEEKENTFLSMNYSVGTMLDEKLCLAFEILDYALIGMPGAPVRQALLDAGIGKDVYGGFSSETYQPMFSVIAKKADPEQKEDFLRVIEETLKEQVKNGIDKKALLAGINSSEFRYREADFGSFPKGLIYGLQVMDSWLYDEKEPFIHLEALPVYAFLREKIDEGRFFEDLVEKYLLNNPHAAFVCVSPKKGLAAEEEEALRQELAEKKEQMTADELQKLTEATRALREWQETPDKEEDLNRIPLLKREEIGREPRPIRNEEDAVDDLPLLYHEIDTNGIAYLRMYFSVPDLSEEELSCLGILKSVLGFMDTEHFSFRELTNEINLYTGGISSGAQAMYDTVKKERVTLYEVRLKVLYENLEKGIELLKEVFFTTDFSDDKRLYEILAEGKSQLSSTLPALGHMMSSLRASSYFSETARATELMSGISLYRLVSRLEENFDAEKEELKKKLQELRERIFVRSRLLVSFTGDRRGLELIKQALPSFTRELKEGEIAPKATLSLHRRNEGFLDASQVQYVSRAGSFEGAGPYRGTLRILRTLLNYDYLWQNLRVMGGAYGCMSSFNRNGVGWFASYRDPNLTETIKIYEGIPEYLKGFSADDRLMTKYIIGTISDIDTPLTPDSLGVRSTLFYFSGTTEEDLKREREEILNATEDDIRALAPYAEEILKGDNLCAIGNENVIGKAEGLFLNKEALL